MLRAITSIYIEGQAFARRDVSKLFRVCSHTSVTLNEQTVLSRDSGNTINTERTIRATGDIVATSPPQPPTPPPTPPPSRSPRVWSTFAALAITVSLGGVYFYRKFNGDDKENELELKTADGTAAEPGSDLDAPIPASAAALPKHAQYLLVGGGTASFAAMRAIRSARPDAQVLIVSAEHALPYMRPPLSKELWREPELAERAALPDSLTFRQWNGRRRSVTYEPGAFYTPAERLAEGGAGAGVARGWRVTRIDPAQHSAELSADGQRHTLTFDKCLIATGVRARRVPALRAAATAGRSLALRGVRDVERLARALDAPDTRTLAVLGGGFLASELTAALAERLRGSGRRVVQVFREPAPLASVLPPYLADDAARRLRDAGVQLLSNTEVMDSTLEEGRVALRLSTGGRLEADLVVECVGSEPETELAAASGLELHERLGGVSVTAELQARADVFAAGDVACFYDVALGRRRVEHHDHAVLSGRLAGENMAAATPLQHYRHQSMFWSDLGPQLGYEAIGIIDSQLPTIGVFSADAVAEETSDNRTIVAPDGGRTASGAEDAPRTETQSTQVDDTTRRFERGVVFYLRDKRVVGVLLWNLFNRMHIARQVLSHGEFEDLFEVAKLFSPHEED